MLPPGPPTQITVKGLKKELRNTARFSHHEKRTFLADDSSAHMCSMSTLEALLTLSAYVLAELLGESSTVRISVQHAKNLWRIWRSQRRERKDSPRRKGH